MAIKPLQINSKALHLMKAVTNADYTAKTVLTNSAWEYVELWLKRQKTEQGSRALFYWKQAYNFYNASECLSIESRPLTAYYCCLNATKALLKMKGDANINFDSIGHGITSDRRQWSNSNIKDAEVIFLGSGVLFELSKYLDEEAIKKTYSVYDLLYNLACVHRAFSITYQCTELFVPIRDVKYIVDTDAKKGWIQFLIDERYANGNSLRFAPRQFEKVNYNSDSRYFMRQKNRFNWDIHEDKKSRLNNISRYHGRVRKDLHYIFGDMRLWYLKKDIPSNNKIIKRNSLTLIFAIMHWLSELTRYNPEKFDKIMSGKQNWLICEFLNNALYQFVDEISCEITSVDIMTSGYRK